MDKWLIFLWFIHTPGLANNSNFRELLQNLNKHPSLQALIHQADALMEKSNAADKWDDPVLKSMVKNLPVESWSMDQTPMTGIEFGISQKIPLTKKNYLSSSRLREKSKAIVWEKEDELKKLQVRAWKLAIDWNQLQKEINLLYQSWTWLNKKLEITRSLYKNGQVSQQAIMEIEKRKASLKREIENRKFLQKKTNIQMEYLFGAENKIDFNLIPFETLQETDASNELVNAKENALESQAKSASLNREAKDLSEIPDLTVGLGYTFRSNLDNQGDFIGLTLAIPIPINNRRDVQTNAARLSEQAAMSLYEDYKNKRINLIKQLRLDLDRLTREDQILTYKSIKYARLAKDIVSKSYGLGNSSYVELLATELSLEELELKKVKYWAELWNIKLKIKYLKGEQLR